MYLHNKLFLCRFLGDHRLGVLVVLGRGRLRADVLYNVVVDPVREFVCVQANLILRTRGIFGRNGQKFAFLIGRKVVSSDLDVSWLR